MPPLPDMDVGWTSRAIGSLNHPETGYPFSVDGILFNKRMEGRIHNYLTLESMPKELLGIDSEFLIRPEIVNQQPVVPVDVENLPSYAVVLNMKPGVYSKEREINAGYQILAKAEVGPVEYALAENPHTHFFATWERTPGNDTDGERNYYWGHYHEDRGKAIVDFCARVSEKCAELSADRKPSIRGQLAAKLPEREVSAPKPRGKEVSL